MELKYVVLTIIKILISVPAILLYSTVDGAAFMGGHLDNKSNLTNISQSQPSSSELLISAEEPSSEEIPNPEPLVSPGYNLPENIFNKGKPFYLEKDPLTGKIDFDSKAPLAKLDDDMYDYVVEEPSSDIYAKANIDRKDGALGSHRPSDVNQLTPNFHDFLNLPVKYNSDKYVYPLISSSYANTKIQGNVNKYQNNHKDYNIKTSTTKPTGSPTYYSSSKNNYFNTSKPTQPSTTTTTAKTTTTTVYLTSKVPPTNLMTGGMNHPSFHEEFDDYYEDAEKTKPNNVHLTTENANRIYLTTKTALRTTKKTPTVVTTKAPTTTTKRTMSLFEQLFGDYDDTVAAVGTTKPPPLFSNLPSNKNTIKNKYSEVKTEKPSFTTPNNVHNAHAGPNLMTGSNMGLDNYEYEDYSSETSQEDNIAVEDKPVKVIKESTTVKSTTTRSASRYSPPSRSTTISRVTPSRTTTSTSTTTTTSTTEQPKTSTSQVNESKFDSDEYYDYEDKENKTTKFTTVTEPTTTVKVTSLPLGENHVTSLNNRQPIIVATQNLREQLNNEKVIPKPFGFDKPVDQPPSTSNVHIAPDQDIVSFVVGNHQNVEGGQYTGTSLKESPYDSNPFRPLYGQQQNGQQQFGVQPVQQQFGVQPGQQLKDSVSYTIQAAPELYKPPNFPVGTGSAVTIQPQVNSEASLAIGVPVGDPGKQIPGQVVDEKLEIDDDKIEYPKGAGPKIVFPDDKIAPPPQVLPPPNNREVLKLSSKPMYHQLPSDLTPPKEKESMPPPRMERPRPPWDPRPGHFYSGKPEYVRPPRPPPEIAYKRIDNLPNILPQFRPNMKPNIPPHYARQPLLERPSNRPIGFFEKLQPPPPPKNLHNLRKIPPPSPNLQSLDQQVAEDRIINEAPPKKQSLQDQFDFYKTPPQVPIANRRIGIVEGDVETLQMIQSKKTDKKDGVTEAPKDGTTNPLYVVYPVNTPPIKLDVIDSNKKEAVVIGTRAELPLPPSKIQQHHFNVQNPLLNPKDRNDAPILKPHPRPSSFPIKSDFPYPLEKPDLNPPETPSNNNLDHDIKFADDNFVSSNQWNTIENPEQTQNVYAKPQDPNIISVTLKTYTEKPIAVAYTPTEPHATDYDKYSMPNYGSQVIPEIRPGTVDNAELPGKPDNEFTVSAVMHTHPQIDMGMHTHPQIDLGMKKYPEEIVERIISNHKIDAFETSTIHHQQDFQAPFQASISVDSLNQGWSVVSRERNKSSTAEDSEVTTLPLATTSEFDIENFKPQLIGGFKPIYSFPEGSEEVDDASDESREG